MRKVTFGGANSLDNYLARPDHSVDWLLWGDEAAEVMADFWKTIDTVVMGRKTWEVAVRMGQGAGYPEVRNFVFSRTLETEPGGNVVVVRSDAAEFVRDLKEQAGKGICVMGGGELAHSLFEAGLIDEIGFKHPSRAPRLRHPPAPSDESADRPRAAGVPPVLERLRLRHLSSQALTRLARGTTPPLVGGLATIGPLVTSSIRPPEGTAPWMPKG